MTETRFNVGDRVRVNEPMVGGEPNPWHDLSGVVVRIPGEEIRSYSVLLDGHTYPAAPFYDETMDSTGGSLIEAEDVDAEIRKTLEANIELGYIEIVGEKDGEAQYALTASGEARMRGFLDDAFEVGVNSFAEGFGMADYASREMLIEYAASLKERPSYGVGEATSDARPPEELSPRERVERYAGLVFNVGTIIEDRRDGLNPTESERLWEYLEENLDWLYEVAGREIIDRVEDEVFPEGEAA